MKTNFYSKRKQGLMLRRLKRFISKKQERIFWGIGLITASVLLWFALIVYAWQNPTQSPPGGNINSFLDTTSTTQTKSGGLNLATVTGNVGIGTTGPTNKLQVVGTIRANDLYLSSDGGSWSSIAFNAHHEGGTWSVPISTKKSLTIEMDDNPERWEFWSTQTAGATDWVLRHALYGNGRAYFSGNVGIGTTSPGAKLEVAGDAKITGGLKPDYDSGWFAENQATSHCTTLNHNLGVFPTRGTIWFSPTNPPGTWIYPRDLYDNPQADVAGEYPGPLSTAVSTTQIVICIWSGQALWYHWNASTWTSWNSGYFRIYLWK